MEPLTPDQPDDSNYSIVRSVFALGYQRAMLDASRIVEKHNIGRLSLDVRTDLVEAGMQGGEIHDAIMRTNEASARVAEQTAADNLAARTRMVTQDAPDVTDYAPAPHGGGTSQDASGGFDRKDVK
jgi:hypothetical protein